MHTYRYTATDVSGNRVDDAIVTSSLEEALATLARQGLTSIELVSEQGHDVASVHPENAEPGDGPERLAPDEAMLLTEQLATLARAGLPLATGLRAAARELSNRRLSAALEWLAQRIDQGQPLDEALVEKPDLMPAHLRRLIVVSAQSGRLPEALDELVEIDDTERDLARRIRLTVGYPVLVLVLFAAFVFVFQAYVMTELTEMFEGFDLELPWITRALTWLSGVRVLLPVAIFVTAAPMIWLAVRFGMSPLTRRRLLSMAPLLGPAVLWHSVARWARLLAQLVEYGIPMPEALRLASDGVNDANVRVAGRGVAQAVSFGRSLSDALAGTPWLPASLVPLVRWGETNGTLPDALRSGAEMLESRVQARTVLMEMAFPPLVFILVAAGTGTIMAAVMYPLFELISALT